MKHKHQFVEHTMPFPRHAREQLKERYGVDFTGQWHYFGQALRNPDLTIRLSNTQMGRYFCACYFANHWYLLLCSREGTVITAYPRLDITDRDKVTLVRDNRYRQINHDEFHLIANPASDRRNYNRPEKKQNAVDIEENMRRDAYREFKNDVLDDNWWQ